MLADALAEPCSEHAFMPNKFSATPVHFLTISPIGMNLSTTIFRKMAYPIRRGYFSEMLLPTWIVNHQSWLKYLMNS